MSDGNDNGSPKKTAPLRHLSHPRPVTRRDLLAQGFIGFSAYAAAPTLMGLLSSSRAMAEGCGSTGDSYMPFMVFDMAGGAALPANFLVGKQGGPEDLLASYDVLGWNPRTSPYDSRFGLPMATNMSQIFRGITERASPAAQALLRMGSICNFSRDDTSSNLTSAIAMIMQTGYRGLFLAKGVGTADTVSGGNSDAVGQVPSLAPVFVRNVGDILRSVSFGSAFNDLTPAAVTALARGSLNVSMAQLGRLPTGPDLERLTELARCGYEQNFAFTQGTEGLDPRNDDVFQGLYGIDQNTADDSSAAITAAITMNVLRANSGPGVLTLGGCDYHDGTQTTGDGKDLDMGRQIGLAVEAAHQVQKPLFFQLLTDGGAYAETGTRRWRGDAGDKSMTVIGYYNPAGAPTQRRIQVGNYTDGQGVDRSTLIGADPAKAAYAVFANYLNAVGKLADFELYAPGVFSSAELDSVLIFG
jgi:hypothetical protein